MKQKQELQWIQNDELQVGIACHGAEVCSVIDRRTNREMLWRADPAVFGDHSPVLFPWTGRLPKGEYTADGVTYAGDIHGFIRNLEHQTIKAGAKELIMSVDDTEETMALWPYHFKFQSTFFLEGKTLHHRLCVTNMDRKEMGFGIGFHPAFAIPFDSRHKIEDYGIAFSKLESPMCLDTSMEGLQNGKLYYLARNTREIQLNSELFANDSHCIVNLRSQEISLLEKDTGRCIRVDLSDFPYTLLWSAYTNPLRFVCIEPWQSLPGEYGSTGEWTDKPMAAVLAPEETYVCELKTTYLMEV